MKAKLFRGRTCFEGYAGRLWFRWPRPSWWRYGARPGIGWIHNDVPACRICGKADQVAVYKDSARKEAICMDCCGGDVEHADGETGHDFSVYDRYDGHSCLYCGLPRSSMPYDPSDYD